MPASLPEQGISLTRGGIALVTELDGSISGEDASGLYARDRRLVAGLELLVNGIKPKLLNRVRTGPAEDRIVYGYWTTEPDPAIVLVRDRDLHKGYNETYSFQSFDSETEIEIELLVTPGGGTVYHLDELGDQQALLEHLRNCFVSDDFVLDSEGLRLRAKMASGPGPSTTLKWGFALDIAQPSSEVEIALTSSDPVIQHTFDRGCWDLTALSVIDERTGLPFLAAGSPHFLALFGRDALLASMFSMLAGTNRALDTLRVLAAYQGVSEDPDTVEHPGRILHELRIGEMGVFGLEPGRAYYGSVDSTPLFIVLLAECLAWGADKEQIKELLPTARRAMTWCREHVDDLGFLKSVPHDTGIGNQGWKDSGDSIVDPEGRVLSEATSLVEVQGYVHAALVGLAELEEHVGDPTLSSGLRQEAAEFKSLFLRHFEVHAPVHLALALDAAGKPVEVRASNVGHLLATQIIDDSMARKLTDRLMSPEEFSGWGLRTLASNEVAYNPLGYHVGSVWPHDTAMFLRGLNLRGYGAEASELAQALLDLAETYDGLPELLGGFDRLEFPSPVPYPSSARPQAWAAAVPVQIAVVLLGIRPAMQRNELRIWPILKDGQSLVIEDLRLGNRKLRVAARGTEVEVTGDVSGLNIIVRQ